jgi:hypothetical protein
MLPSLSSEIQNASGAERPTSDFFTVATTAGPMVVHEMAKITVGPASLVPGPDAMQQKAHLN